MKKVQFRAKIKKSAISGQNEKKIQKKFGEVKI